MLTRRAALALLGTTGAALLSASASRLFAAEPAGGCVVTPEQTEGPYFVDERLNRADIRSDPADGSVKDGAPLTLKLVIAGIAGGRCAPLVGAVVDIWHCDVAGAYSETRDRQFDTRGRKFLRGYQVTDANGGVQFTTIYPGWYEGRAVHIHFKVRGTTAQKRGYELTSQFYFDDAFSDRVFSRNPYVNRGRRAVRNERDGLFRDGGNRLIMPVSETGAAYAGNFNIGIAL
ncbi:MAG: twin-arginine translocation pathway signal protein [Betaproteobacteria bacterium]|nr:twin-arginine translocation pathway signal protein [Betaproteobacteria bacterium]